MHKTFITCTTFLLLCVNSIAQKTDTSENVSIDTSEILQNLQDLLGNGKLSFSYVLVEISAGNRLFSLNNNRLNARQSSISTLVYTPSIGYFHKSGLSLSGGVYLLNDHEKGFGASQYSITPSFDLLNNKHIGLSISYTHYFVKDHYSVYASPVQNDFYVSLSSKKGWLKPGIAGGYSTGIYKQVFEKDTTIGIIHRHIYDSATFNLRSVSMLLSAGHDFDWENIFSKKDGITFTPAVVVNFGSYNIDVSHKTNAPNLLQFLLNRGRLPKFINSSFRAESVGLNLNLVYAIGNFSFSPKAYLDYYLPETDTDKFTQTFNLTVGYAF